ncbi:MAG: DUF3365 domain-containing protein [Pseudomonadota bacterium]
MTLRLKFNIALLSAFLLGYAATGFLLYNTLQENARDEVLAKARIMRESALAIRAYTVEQVRPLLATLSQDQFLPQTVPSYAAQENFRKLDETFSDYTYKEAALNPTNPTDLAADWERDIINYFRNDETQKEYVAIRDTPEGQSLALAFPLQIKNEACLTCHSVPANAPQSMLDLYGDDNGFGWQLNEIIGAQILTVPMSVPIERANHTFAIVMSALAGIFVVVFLLLNILLSISVIRPVRRLTDLAGEVSMGNLDAPEMEAKGSGEIASLAQSFNRMRRSLENAMRMIGG